MLEFAELVKHYPELRPEQRAKVRKFLRNARYVEIVHLLADPDTARGLQRARADYRGTSGQSGAATVAFAILGLMVLVAAIAWLVQ